LRYPKLRELKEAVIAIFSPRFTTRFPAQPCQVPEKYRGKPQIDADTCIGCGACVNVCPTNALTQEEDLQASPPIRKIISRYDACIFCGTCQDNCTTEKSIKLTNQWDLATMDRESTVEAFPFELQRCEKCDAVIGTKKHLVWLYEKLGPLAYTNPSLLIAKNNELLKNVQHLPPPDTGTEPQTGDFMRILCPKCKCELNVRL